MTLINKLQQLHTSIFSAVESALDGWFLGFTARLVFSSALFFFFVNSAISKVGEGFFGIFSPSAAAYAQILPHIAEAVVYDTSKIDFFPWTIIVIAGTVAELILPITILLGLFTRLSSLAFIGVIAVMTYVDIALHGVPSETIGAFFDQQHNAEIADLRILWLFPLFYLIIKGPGKISLDYLLSKFAKQDETQAQ
ncbi:MAG: DoxX family protein [Cohaesibacter sp.]|jgi:putative oxidoreductase|nr:DoxX family protein [Cohaesibacter sp.]